MHDVRNWTGGVRAVVLFGEAFSCVVVVHAQLLTEMNVEAVNNCGKVSTDAVERNHSNPFLQTSKRDKQSVR